MPVGSPVARHAFNVVDTFEIQGRGLVVATDMRYKELPSWLAFKIGDEIELHSKSHILRTRIAGIEHCDPWTPETTFGFLLPADVSKDQLPIGCEVWITEASTVK
ncbi:MAG: hypothetical protein C0478_10230 [Planctomyces sp.]|nr:hypothetical protein [Planctomyces sp.]